MNRPNLVLRPEDAAAMAELSGVAEPAPWSEASWHDQLSQPNCLVLATGDPAAELDGAIALSLVHGFAEILNLLVRPEQRRKGLASQLLSAGLKRAGERGIARLCLDVNISNFGARALYERFGFTEDGRRLRYYPDGSDALLMSREV